MTCASNGEVGEPPSSPTVSLEVGMEDYQGRTLYDESRCCQCDPACIENGDCCQNAATALANIGPGLGDTIGPAGNFAPLNTAAKWMLIAAMLIGRLELMAVYVMLTVKFWRA